MRMVKQTITKQGMYERNNPANEDHRARSNFVRSLVQNSQKTDISKSPLLKKPPRRIVQFWNDMAKLPKDVSECIDTWRKLERQGFEFLLFDEQQAKDFIGQILGSRHVKAFDACYHPAMQSDYFRLCYILIEGGCYVDTDDVYHGSNIEYLFSNGLLKIQPLCYDISTGEMVPPAIFTEPIENALSWIFYFNNNPLISGCGHPILELALASATNSLLKSAKGELPDIQSTTGPGNLTKSIFDATAVNSQITETLHIQSDWEEIATSKWPLSYRGDQRNWRLSNRRAFDQESL